MTILTFLAIALAIIVANTIWVAGAVAVMRNEKVQKWFIDMTIRFSKQMVTKFEDEP